MRIWAGTPFIATLISSAAAAVPPGPELHEPHSSLIFATVSREIPQPIQQTARHRELAHQLAEVLGAGEAMVQGFRRGLQQNLTELRKKGMTDEEKEEEILSIYSESRAEFYVPGIEKEYEDVYSELFTDGELEDILRFYSTGWAREFVSRLPDIESQAVARSLARKGQGLELDQELSMVIDDMTEILKSISVNKPTADQINAIVSFYRSNGGRALLRSRPLLRQRAVEIAQSFMRQVTHDRMEKWCDLHKCTPLMRSWIDHPELMKSPPPSS